MAYLAALLVTAIATVINLSVLYRMDHANLIMVYLAGIVYVASKFGRGPSIFASLASVAAFDFFFIPPRYTLAIADTQFILTFAIMLSIALIISTLTAQVQEKALLAKEKERRTAALLAMSRELAVTREQEQLIAVSLKHIRTFHNVRAGIYLPDHNNRLCQLAIDDELPLLQSEEDICVRWSFDNSLPTGLGLGAFPQASSLYMPLVASKGAVGILQVSPRQPDCFKNKEEIEVLEIFANQTALCIETTNLADASQRANIRIEKEQLRNTFLNSISHDLRTPLATITGASSTLLEDQESLDPTKQQELAQIIFEEGERLNSLLNKLLEMTRIESGVLELHKEWQPLEEIIGTALVRMEKQLGGRRIKIDLPETLPLIAVDELMFQQVFQNFIENAVKYDETKNPLEIKAWIEPKEVIIEFADGGPGIKEGEEEEIFTKFYRSARAGTTSGAGLGLAICRSIIQAHGGTISARNNPGGGAIFSIRLPLNENPPVPLPEIGFDKNGFSNQSEQDV